VINPGHPSRDIAAVDTNQGPVLASVDATDDAVSFYVWRDGSFGLMGSLATGSLPAQIVTGNLTGDGLNDLVVRNAGDGTLSVSLNAGIASGPTAAPPLPFLPAMAVPVGLGVSDVTLAAVSGDGRTDIVVANKLTGEVGVVRNLSSGVFAPVTLYRAGGGVYAAASTGGAAPLTTSEATAGVAAGSFAVDGPPSLLAINPGSNTLSMLNGLSAGRFANPMTLPTASPAIAVRVADLEGIGIPDAILLSARGVTVYRGDGKGGFLPAPFTIAAGPDPTGMTVADINHDGKPDLLVGNAVGDLLVLLGNGDGTFQPYHKADQQVALAVLPNGSSTPDFIYADHGLDRVVVDDSGGRFNVLGDRSSGVIAPGAVQLADLNGDGIPDLIVANSGSNNVLVYPGLPGGQFGEELNGGHGFFTGTDPVGITVANLNGRPDLVIPNKGSNDVSILLNVPTSGGGFTFVPGPRLQGGVGPTSTVVQDVNGDGIPDLLVSDGGSNQVRLLPGVGSGFFNDHSPTIYSVGSTPNQVLVGTFMAGQGPQIVTVNSGSNDVTVISDVNGNAPVIQSFPTGGIDPVASFAVDITGNGAESLVVANSGDGLFTLLGGTESLGIVATLSSPALPQPSALALSAVDEHEVAFYATTDGVEAALALAFILPGRVAPISPARGGPTQELVPLFPLDRSFVTTAVPGGFATEGPAQLIALNDASLPLVGTLLPVVVNSRSSLTVENQSGSQAELSIALLPGATPPSSQNGTPTASETTTAATSASASAPASSAGQSLLTPGTKPEVRGGEEGNRPEDQVAGAVPRKSANPFRLLLDIDAVFEEIHKETQPAAPGSAEPDPAPDAMGGTPGAALPSPEIIDAALQLLGAGPPPSRTGYQPAVSRPETRFPASLSIETLLMLSATLIVRAGPLAEMLRDIGRQRTAGADRRRDGWSGGPE
jgi:hypothetical protein